MDNDNLNELLANTGGRQFWIKQWGDPDKEADVELQSTTDLDIPIDFSTQPRAVEIGDILIIHRTKHAKIMFVAEIRSESYHSTPEDIEKDYWRERWCWRVDTRNLTPTYGSQWGKYSLKPFALAKEYNQANPNDENNLGRLNFGAHVRVSEGFAKFIFKEIMRLESSDR